MPIKEWFRQLQPVQIYVILALTIIFFITELVTSYVTHALTLLIDSYHTLCNVIALLACIITMKYGKDTKPEKEQINSTNSPGVLTSIIDPSVCADKTRPIVTRQRKQEENKLKNNFGWTRIDVIGMLMCCVFLTSSGFSILVEAFQALIHIDKHDKIHNPIQVFCTGVVGLILNGICYLSIGGYTFRQGSFLYMTNMGCAALSRIVTGDSVSKSQTRLSRTRIVLHPQYRQQQGFKEVLRDIVGCIIIIICAILTYFTKKDVAKYIDPILSLVSVGALMILNFPYMKKSCLILLQSIPDTINIDSLQSQLLQHFPDIVNVHDLHVWQLTATRVISTVHMIFHNPADYLKIKHKLKEFFLEHGINQVTIQPEFLIKTKSDEKIHPTDSLSVCLMKCPAEECKSSQCCPDNEPKVLFLITKSESSSKELVVPDSPANLKSIKIDTQELPILDIAKTIRTGSTEKITESNNLENSEILQKVQIKTETENIS